MLGIGINVIERKVYGTASEVDSNTDRKLQTGSNEVVNNHGSEELKTYLEGNLLVNSRYSKAKIARAITGIAYRT